MFLGLGLAAAISTALLVARHQARRSYRPGSGRRDELPVAPVVYQLRLAHLRDTHPEENPADTDTDDGAPQAPAALVIPPPDVSPDTDPSPDPRTTPVVGVRGGQEVAVDLGRAGGLGLVGDGAPAAARALLLALLTRTGHARAPVVGNTIVVVPTEDLALLLGPAGTGPWCPDRLRVVPDLEAALDELEAEILTRTRDCDAPEPRPAPPVMVLVAQPCADRTHRLQAVLEHGTRVGIVGILLGQWRAGISACVRDDGTVTATSPGAGETLRGTQLYRLPPTETSDLLALLRQAQPTRAQFDQTPGTDPAGPDAGNPTAAGATDADTELELTALPPNPTPTTTSPGPDPATAAPNPQPDSAPRTGERTAPIALSVLGCPRVHWRPPVPGEDPEVRDITAAFPPRQRELLVFLALHPTGVHRDTLVAALWQDNPERPTNALNTALSRLRRAISTATGGTITDLLVAAEGRYQLHPHLIEVDYWHFRAAVTTRRAATTDPERLAATRHIVDSYRGTLAEGLDAEWIDPAREAIRRDALDAVAALARAHIDTDPAHTLDLLETARAVDPYNELIYRDILRLQARLGLLEAIPRTLSLLTTRLAEIGEQPTAATRQLSARLQQHPTAAETPVTTGTDDQAPARR